MKPIASKTGLLLGVAILLLSLVSPTLAVFESPSAAQPEPDDEGWVFDLAPGGIVPGLPTALALDETNDRVYAGTSNGWLLAFDRRTHQPAGRAQVSHGISSLVVDGAAGKVYAGGERHADQTQQVSVLSLPGLALQSTIQISAGAMLRQLFHDPEAGRLYALVFRPSPTTASADLVVLDGAANPTGQVWQLGPSVQAAAFDGQTGRLFALAPNFEAQAATVRAYDREGALVGETGLSIRATQLLLDPARRHLFATAGDSTSAGRLEVLDADTLAGRGSLGIARQPQALALDPSNGRIWLAGTRSAPILTPVLEVLDPIQPATVAVINYDRPAAGYSAQTMAVDPIVRRLWVANNDDSLSVLDLDSHQPVATVITAEGLSDLGVDEGTGRIFALSNNSDTVYALNPAGGGLVGRVATGRNSTSMRVDERSGRLYVLNKTARSFSVIDGRALRHVVDLPLATPPTDTGWDVDPELGRVFLWQNGEVVAIAADSGQEVGRAAVANVGLPTAALVVDRDSHLVYILGYTSAILDGRTLRNVGELPGQPLSLAIDRVNRRAYGVNWCTAKSCGNRTYVYDLRDHSLLAQLEGVGEVKALNPALGHLYFPGQPAHVVDAFTFQRTATAWRASDIAVDSGRGRIYLLGETNHSVRAVPDRYPSSAESARERSWAKIQIVWPHDGAPVSEANLANIGATIFEPTTFRPLSANFGGRVQLWRALNNEPAVPVAEGAKRIAPWPVGEVPACADSGFPIWEFNDVDVSAARDPNNKVFFYLTVDGQSVAANVWGHAVDARTYFPRQDVPVGTAAVAEAVDTSIQIVWPNDGAGNERPVDQAAFANVGVIVFNHGTRTSVPADWNPVVRLYRSLDNGVEQYVGMGRKEVVVEGSQSWPRWAFDGVDVSAAKDTRSKYYFRAVVDDKTTYAGVWSHGADGRTYFPQQDIPVAWCP